MVPQRKNPDGTVDVTGPGRLICYDRVFIPSHEEAFRDSKAPIANVIKSNNIGVAYEQVIDDADFNNYAFENSENAKFILDGMAPAMESMTFDVKNMMMSVNTNEDGRVFIPMRANKKVMSAVKDYMKRW